MTNPPVRHEERTGNSVGRHRHPPWPSVGPELTGHELGDFYDAKVPGGLCRPRHRAAKRLKTTVRRANEPLDSRTLMTPKSRPGPTLRARNGHEASYEKAGPASGWPGDVLSELRSVLAPSRVTGVVLRIYGASQRCTEKAEPRYARMSLGKFKVLGQRVRIVLGLAVEQGHVRPDRVVIISADRHRLLANELQDRQVAERKGPMTEGQARPQPPERYGGSRPLLSLLADSRHSLGHRPNVRCRPRKRRAPQRPDTSS